MSTFEMGLLDGANTLQELADTVSQLIENPITIEASDFRLLAYSQHAEKVDTVRLNTILLKRAPDNIARLLSTSGILARLTASPEPLRVSLSEAGLTDRVAIPVKIGDSLVGVMWVHEVNRKLNERDFLLLQHATRLAAGELASGSQKRRTRRDSVSRFLGGLLTGQAEDPATADITARELNLVLPSPFVVMVMDGSEKEADLLELLAAELARHASLMYQTPVLWAVRDKEVAFLSGLPTGRQPFEAIAAYVAQEAEKRGNPVKLGVSRLYTHIDDAPAAYLEARACLFTAVLLPHEKVLSARALGSLRLLPPMARTYAEIAQRGGLSEKVSLLIKEDAGRSSSFSFVDTLETYLDCGGDAKEAARRLHIHSHALHYRLRRITEVSGVDAANGIEMLAIHLELKLRKLGSATE